VLETIVNSATNWPTAWPTLLVAHRHLNTLLALRGYTVNYGEFFGGHELLSSRWALAEALPFLLRPNAIK
jgi:enterochelin esterase-like enzyme